MGYFTSTLMVIIKNFAASVGGDVARWVLIINPLWVKLLAAVACLTLVLEHKSKSPCVPRTHFCVHLGNTRRDAERSIDTSAIA